MSKYLPVYLLVDASGSMNGEPINAVNEGLRAMMSALRDDPYALESVKLSLITFELEIKEIFGLTSVKDIILDDIVPPRSGPTHLGGALEYMVESYYKDKSSENFAPMLFIMTDGKPSDSQLFKQMVAKVKTMKFGSIVGCVAGPKAKKEYLEEFSDTVVSLETTDSSSFGAFFKWVSDSISNQSSGELSGNNKLPPPPAEINIVL